MLFRSPSKQRLDQLLTSLGFASRSESKKLIAAGLVTVAGEIIKNIGTRRQKVINECNHLFEITECLKSRYTNYNDIVKMIDLEKDLCLYHKSLLNNSLFHFNACIIAWKYRNLWFNNYPELIALAKFIV